MRAADGWKREVLFFREGERGQGSLYSRGGNREVINICWIESCRHLQMEGNPMESYGMTVVWLAVNWFMLKCPSAHPESDRRKLMIKQSNTVFILGMILSVWYLLALLFIDLLNMDLAGPEPNLLIAAAILFSVFCSYLKCIKK